MDNYNYPMGADTKDAPWNQVDNPEREEGKAQKVELSAVSVSEVPVRVTNAYLNTNPSEPVSITGTVSVDNFPSSGTES